MTAPPASPSGVPVGPTRRNALVTWLIPMVCFALAPPLGNFLGQTAFRFAPTAAILAGTFITLMHARVMIAELNAAAGSGLVFWHLFIPIYGLYWAAVPVQKEMMVAKQRVGVGAPRGSIVYALLFLYAIAADLDDLAAQGGSRLRELAAFGRARPSRCWSAARQ